MNFNRIISAAVGAVIFCGACSGISGGIMCASAEELLFTETSGELTYAVFSDHAEITRWDESSVSADIPDSLDGLPVTVIGDSAFSGCAKLKSVSIPDTVVQLDDYAFADCTSLEEVTVPESVERIGNFAFFRCSSLKNITIPDTLTSMGTTVFSGTPWLKAKPYGPVYIGKMLCTCRTSYGPEGLVEEVDVEAGTVALADTALANKQDLRSVVIPESVKVIGKNAVYCCQHLESVTILSRDCEIFDSDFTISSAVLHINGSSYGTYHGVIRGFAGSTAEAYAKKYGYRFEVIEESGNAVLFGDANCDGNVTVADAAAILQFLGNQEVFPLSGEGKRNADVCNNGDGITAKDALVIQLTAAGIYSAGELPVKR